LRAAGTKDVDFMAQSTAQFRESETKVPGYVGALGLPLKPTHHALVPPCTLRFTPILEPIRDSIKIDTSENG